MLTTTRLPVPRRETAIALGLLTLGLVLRGLDLGHESLWFDECFTLDQAHRATFAEVVKATAADNYPPLHNLLVHAWIALFGEGREALRWSSALLSSGAIWVGGGLARELYGPRARLIAMALLATLPEQVRYGQMLRMYALFSLLALASTWCLARWLARPTHRRLTLWVVITAAACWTHYYAGFLVIGQAAAVLTSPRRSRPPMLPWLVAQGAVLALFSPWLPVMFERFQALDGHFWIQRPGVGGLAHAVSESWPLTTLLAVALAALAVVPHLPHALARATDDAERVGRWDATRLLLGAWLGPVGLAWVLSYVTQPMFLLRYLLGAFAVGTVLVAAGIARFAAAWVRVGLTLVLVLATVPRLVDWYREDQYAHWDAIGQRLAREVGPRDQVLVVPQDLDVVLRVSTPGLTLPPLVGVPGPPPTRTARVREAVGETIWLVVWPTVASASDILAPLTNVFETLSVDHYPNIELYRLQRRADAPSH